MGLNVSWPCSLDYVRTRTLGVQGVKYHDGGLWNASDVQGVPQKLSADQVQGLRGVDEARVEPASLLVKTFSHMRLKSPFLSGLVRSRSVIPTRTVKLPADNLIIIEGLRGVATSLEQR